jgi:hypothetical protein
MKTPLLLATALALFVSAPAQADSGGNYTFIKTNFGKVYTNCRVIKTDPDGVYILHQNGAAKLLFSDLPEDARTTLGYNPEKASQYEKDRAEAKKKEREEQWKYRCEAAKAETAAYNAETARLQAMAAQTYSAGGGYGGYAYDMSGFPGYGYSSSYGYNYGTGYYGGFGNGPGCPPFLGNRFFNRNRSTFPAPANAGINVIGRNVFTPAPCRVPLATPAMGRLTPALGAGKH